MPIFCGRDDMVNDVAGSTMYDQASTKNEWQIDEKITGERSRPRGRINAVAVEAPNTQPGQELKNWKWKKGNVGVLAVQSADRWKIWPVLSLTASSTT